VTGHKTFLFLVTI